MADYGDAYMANLEVDHLRAELAAKDARHEKDMLEIIDRRDAAEDCIGQIYFKVTGRSPEWSNKFDYDDALEEIEAVVATKDARIAALEAKIVEWMKVSTRKGEAHFLKELHRVRADNEALRKELAEAKAALARTGVCMSCWNGLPMYEQGCTDCLNTGWRDGRSPAEAALEAANARIAELEAQLKRRDPDVTRMENRTDNSSGWANACDQEEGA